MDADAPGSSVGRRLQRHEARRPAVWPVNNYQHVTQSMSELSFSAASGRSPRLRRSVKRETFFSSFTRFFYSSQRDHFRAHPSFGPGIIRSSRALTKKRLYSKTPALNLLKKVTCSASFAKKNDSESRGDEK